MELDGIPRGQVVQIMGFVERIHLVIKRRRAGWATPGSSGRDLERATWLSVHGCKTYTPETRERGRCCV